MQAQQLTAGQRFTDDTGHTFIARKVVQGMARGAGVYVYVEGQGHPEFYLNETPVTVRPAPRPVVDPKPYKVYTRDYKANGDCDKRIYSFATRAAQTRFVQGTNKCVTFTN